MSDLQQQIEDKRKQIQQCVSEMRRLDETFYRLSGHLECLETLYLNQVEQEKTEASSLDLEILTQTKETK